MSDQVALFVDRLVTPPAMASGKVDVVLAAEIAGASSGPSCSRSEGEEWEHEEDEPLIQDGECRICQEEDSVHNLESPCGCSGSLKYAHRKCVQHWCNEKGDITCEICHKLYQPGYTAPPRPPCPEDAVIDIGGGWTITGTPIDLGDPRLLAIAEAERHFLEAEYDEYAASNASGAAFCRSAALILMALLILRHTLTVTEANADDDVSTFFSVSKPYNPLCFVKS
ncbi:E3 ubiquitin-protein ligase MARCHF3 [Linum perenne]